MVDYVKSAQTAERLMRKNGRAISLFTVGKTPVDPNKPWLGGSGDAIEHPCYGVFVPPNQVRVFGLSALGESTKFDDLLMRSEQIAMTYVPEEVDVKIFNFLRDTDGSVWKIDAYQELRPGSIRILTYFGTSR